MTPTLESILQLVEDAHGALGVRRNFRHSGERSFTGSEYDEDAIISAAEDLEEAIKQIKALAGD